MNQKRQHARLDYEIDVKIALDDQLQHGRSINISQGGIFIDSEPAPPFGAKVLLHLDLQGVPKTCKIPCVIRWSKEGEGIGLQFEQLRAIEVWALNKLMNSLKAD